MVVGKLANQMKKNEITLLSYTILRINSKWIKDLKVRTEIIKVLEEKLKQVFMTNSEIQK